MFSVITDNIVKPDVWTHLIGSYNSTSGEAKVSVFFIHSKFSSEILLPQALILDPTKARFNKYPICIFSIGVRERRFAWFLARLWGSWRLLGLQSMFRELWPGRKISSRLCRRFLHIQLCSRTWSDQRPSTNQMPWKSNKLTKTSLSSCRRKMVECKANGARASEKIRS